LRLQSGGRPDELDEEHVGLQSFDYIHALIVKAVPGQDVESNCFARDA
jgi:hypothetical protein